MHVAIVFRSNWQYYNSGKRNNSTIHPPNIYSLHKEVFYFHLKI